jgi:TolA-binding protein
MGRLPPLPRRSDNGWQSSESAGRTDSSDDYSAGQVRTQEVNALWSQADEAERQGDLLKARDLLREYLEKTASRYTSYWYEMEDRQARRNSALDRLDALTALDKGVSLSALQSYLEARRAYDTWLSNSSNSSSPANTDQNSQSSQEIDALAAKVRQAIDAVSAADALKDNVAYLRAAFLYRLGEMDQAARDFGALAARYPHSEKREAAMFMFAVIKMKQSSSFINASGDLAHLQLSHKLEQSRAEYMKRSNQTDAAETIPEPPAIARDAAWLAARAGFLRLIREYPHGRYGRDARGWLAHLDLRAGDRAGAMVEYYRLLGDEEDEAGRVEAAVSLSLVRHHASESEMRLVEAELSDEPAAALAYAYHNIYNYAVDPGCQLGDYTEEEEEESSAVSAEEAWKIKEQVRENRARAIERRELSRIASFATRMMRRYPGARVGGGFALRIAQANLESGENKSALLMAGRALKIGVEAEERDRALWVKGVAEHRLHKYDDARKSLGLLIAENPRGTLTAGARRLLAMAAEDAGDLEVALEQYIALDYQADVAYFVDVLMTIDQLAGFIERHTDSARHAELLYGLGVRYLRAGLYAQAREVFSRVRTAASKDESYTYWYREEKRQSDPKEVYEMYGETIAPHGYDVRAGWVMRDLKTIEQMERLEREAAQAEGDEAKAEALYQLASYLFEGSRLVFYNPAAWRGVRYWNIVELDSGDRYRQPHEAQMLWDYMQEHESYSRALSIYLEVVRKYPQTRAARDALYTAAVCHERLSNYNPYWRSIYEKGMFAGERMVTYGDVKAAYPDYKYPRGTWGWEPSTRTVNGGPGWAAPPKPKPRPTRWQRTKTILLTIWQHLVNFWNETGRRWLIIALTLASTLLAGQLAARARGLLRAELSRRRLARRTQTANYTWLSAGVAEPPDIGLRDRMNAAALDLRDEIRRLALDPRGRPLLLLNVLTHTILAGLLFALARTLY